MPIDPRIPLGVQPAPIADPYTALTQVLQGQKAASELRVLRQQEADDRAIRQVLTETGGDMEAALPRLRTIAPAAALKFETEIANQRKAGFETLKAQTEYRGKQLDLGLKVAQSIGDEASYRAARPMLLALSPQLEPLLPETYDPVRLQQVLDMGLSAKEKADRQTEGLKLFTEGKTAEGLGTWLSTVSDAQTWDATLQRAREMRVPEPIIAQFGAWSPEAPARAAQLSMTPAKRAELGAVTYQDVPMLLDGKLTRVGFNPKTNTYHFQGQDVTTRVRQPPPAVDPNLAATRELQNTLLRMQLEGGGLTPNQRAQEINTLRNGWTRQIQPVLERRGAVAKVDAGLAALASGNRNAATQIIVTAFNKLQDETSVVREGEYARSEQGQALVARIQGAIDRVSQGGSNLTDTDLRGLADEAKNVARDLERVSTEALGDTRQAIEATLDDYKIPHDRVFGSSTIGRGLPESRPAPPGTRIGETKTFPNGNVGRWDGTGWRLVTKAK